MRLAYLTNEYPAPSHTFIRREIAAVEAAAAVTVARFAVRPSSAPLATPADREERSRTRYLLGGRSGRFPGAAVALALAKDVLITLVRRPLRLAKALRWALRLSRGANPGVLTHLGYCVQACALARRARAAGTDHIHVHFASNPAAIALLCERLGGPPWSLTVHGPEEFDDPVGHRLAEKIAAARFVVGVSAFTAEALRHVAQPADAGKVHVVPCGLDAEFLSATPSPVAPERRLLCVGRLSGRKRQALLVRALRRVVARGFDDARLTLIGDGPQRAAIEREIAASSLGGRVDLVGWRGEGEVRAALCAARCFVLPSSAEGLPIAIMEALALGRPVIVTRVAGIPELVEDGVSGWLVPVDDEEALADAIEQAFTATPARLAEMGAAGRRRVLERHDARRSAAALLELIRRG